MTTRKAQGTESAMNRDQMRPEYRFDYTKARPNRFASQVMRDAVVVVLDPDVAEVFHDSARVNAFLRAAIEAKSTG